MSLTDKINSWFSSSTTKASNTAQISGHTFTTPLLTTAGSGNVVVNSNPYTYTISGESYLTSKWTALVGELRLSIEDVLFTATKNAQRATLMGLYNPLDARVLIDSLENTRSVKRVNIFDSNNKYMYTIDECSFIKLEYSQNKGNQFELTFAFKNVVDDPKVKKVYEMTLKGK